MKTFYRDIVGLPILEDWSDTTGIVFFKIGAGYGGHTTVLALFDQGATQRDVHENATRTVSGAGSSLHHLALTIDYDRQDALCAFLTGKDIAYTVEEFAWIGWRGIFIRDPEGNTVEFVAGGHPKEPA